MTREELIERMNKVSLDIIACNYRKQALVNERKWLLNEWRTLRVNGLGPRLALSQEELEQPAVDLFV